MVYSIHSIVNLNYYRSEFCSAATAVNRKRDQPPTMRSGFESQLFPPTHDKVSFWMGLVNCKISLEGHYTGIVSEPEHNNMPVLSPHHRHRGVEGGWPPAMRSVVGSQAHLRPLSRIHTQINKHMNSRNNLNSHWEFFFWKVNYN